MSLRDDNQRGKSKGKYRDSFDFPFGCAQGQDDKQNGGTILDYLAFAGGAGLTRTEEFAGCAIDAGLACRYVSNETQA